MPRAKRSADEEMTYSLGVVARLTGLSQHVLRAWERRYGAVTPLRTEGGTRRYRESDVARLRLLAAAVEAGHPISDVARLGDDELRRRSERRETEARPSLNAILDALDALDAEETERLLGIQLAALGPHRFARAVVLPLLAEIGARWERHELCIASEHLASEVVRSLLGALLRRRSVAAATPPFLFTTLSGDRHELALLVAAVTAAELGAHAVYLGPELPAKDVALAAEKMGAGAVVAGISCVAPTSVRSRCLRQLRAALPGEVALWLGGRGVEGITLPKGVEAFADLDAFEQRVAAHVLRPDQPLISASS